MKTILLVEDDPFISDIYSTSFIRSGYKVDIANDGQMAVDKAKSKPFDLVVLDIVLPKLDGWGVLKALRADPTTKDLKVVVLSNQNEKDCLAQIADFKVIKHFLKVETLPEEVVKFAAEVLK